MARTRVRIASLLALIVAPALVAGCTSGPDKSAGSGSEGKEGRPVVVVTTTWEGAFAKAAGAEDVTVIVPQSVHHAPDYDPKPSDLAAVAKADFVVYAPFEPYAQKIKEAAGSRAKPVEVNLDNDAEKVKTEVARLGKLFGTEKAAAKWTTAFDAEYGKLAKDLKAAWPGGRSPNVVSQVFTTWSAKLAGATTVGTYGPEAVTPAQLAKLSKEKPRLVLDNAHMSTGTVLPGSGARQVKIVNYPGQDLDLLPVYRNAAAELKKAMSGS
ncbi:metal ABC transporter solute-binding protein, Zn/Mn family [Streptomyces sp. NPDC058989]|uniref:metal ABC transporter solute-binding protein, Zn/Mn family n=1 Tax=Streptomyces sp. NPDC058989 TaxID=3346686 RepID=UPI003697504A